MGGKPMALVADIIGKELQDHFGFAKRAKIAVH
jgi:hypothetical protein